MPKFSPSLEAAIHEALALANARKHQFSTLEHLLLGLVDEVDANYLMRACAVDVEKLKSDLLKYLDEDLGSLVSNEDDGEAVPTAAFQRVVQRAAIHVQSSGRQEVTGGNILVAIFAERESSAAYFLQEQDMTRYDAVNFIAHGVAKDPALAPSLKVGEMEREEEAADPNSFLPSAEGYVSDDYVSDGYLEDNGDEERLTESEWRRRYFARVSESGQDASNAPRPQHPTDWRRQTAQVSSRDKFVFLSYATPNRELSRGFLELLNDHGVKVWWDQDLRPGEEWREEIKKRLEQASAVVTLWTNESTVSKAVIEEASTAQANRKLVHIRMDRSEIPYGFAETQYVDLTEWDGTSSHPDFQRIIHAIQDKTGERSTEAIKARLDAASPVKVVAGGGRLTIKDAPTNVPPQINDPVVREQRILALVTTITSVATMCSDNTSYQLPNTLHHCLDALRSAASTAPVTWYALDDAKHLLGDCMSAHDASGSWNEIVCSGLNKILERIEEVRPFLQPHTAASEFDDVIPPSPEPVVQSEDVLRTAEIADDLQAEFSSAEGEAVLDDNTRQTLAAMVANLRDLSRSFEQDERRLPKVRRAVKGLAQITGGVVIAIGSGVMVNLLTAPNAAATLLKKLQPLLEALLKFFV